MQKKNFRRIIFTIISLTSLFAFSCKKERPRTKKHLTDVVAQNKNVKTKVTEEDPLSKLEGKNIVVLLGYGYNTEETVTKIRETLGKKYGIESENSKGLISLFVYPEDFLVSGKERVSKLSDLVKDKTLCGMIILGAPEGTHIALSKIEDSYEAKTVDYPVISLFPQDDNLLGTESTATFVLDYAQKSGTMDSEVTDFIPNFDPALLLTNTIQALINLKEPLDPKTNLFKFVQNLAGKNRTVKHYVDSETNLQSINHFVFE